MYLNKAIEILELNVKQAAKQMPPDTLTALELGIEALIRLNNIRSNPGLSPAIPLSLETPTPSPSNDLAHGS